MTQTDEYKDKLRAWFPPGSTVYTVLRHVSRSGMQRVIGVVRLARTEDGEFVAHPNHMVASVIGRNVSGDYDGVVCRGAGMDMGFDLVYSLSHALYGDGYALKQAWL